MPTKWEKEGNINFDLIKKYAFINIVKNNERTKLSAQVINDLNLNEVFPIIDYTISKIGEQYLYYDLINPRYDKEIESNLISYKQTSKNDKRQINTQLKRLSDDEFYFICNLLGENVPSIYTRNLYEKNITYIIFALVILSLFNIKFIFLALPIIAINLVIHFRVNIFYNEFLNVIIKLRTLVSVSKEINQIKDYNNKATTYSIKKLNQIKTPSLLLFRFGNIDDITETLLFFISIFKALFLIDILLINKIIKLCKSNKEEIIQLFEYIGNIDKTISIYELRCNKDFKTSQPVFIKENKYQFKNIYHPIISRPSKNSLEVNNSVLITGSNMSGKSTFLRTILLNVILSQSLNTCFSDEFSLPFSQVYSSISTQDNIVGGASLFYVELALINEMIHDNDESMKLLLIDEIFKGTNSIERQSLALATLRYLKSKSNVVVISTTHDIEIATLLRGDFDLYYLSNYIKDGEMFFDHFLKHGINTSTNAINLAQSIGFPNEIITNAHLISRTIVSNNSYGKI